MNDDNDPFDDHRHGTHVSGTIGAAGNNGVGVVGVNWNVKIMALKFLNSAGSGTTADAIAVDALRGRPRRRRLVQLLGWGAVRPGAARRDRVRRLQGMLFVAAAGNDGFNNDVTPTYPATYGSDAVLAVAATDSERRAGLLLELRRQDGRSRSSRRRHPLDDAREHLRDLRRDLDGHAARRGRGRARRGPVPGSDALRDQGAAHELGRSGGVARGEDGDGRPAQHR